MTTQTHTIQPVDSLTLLSLKVASNVFDVSSGLHHVSIRDQIVRAKMLVRDLKKGDESLNRLLIVGAGVAGMSAALTACALGVKEVVVVEAMTRPFMLLRRVTARHVGPFMYEWPSSFFDNQSYPETSDTLWLNKTQSPFCWDSKAPLRARDLAILLESDLKEKFQKGGVPLPTVLVKVEKSRIKRYVRYFAAKEGARALIRVQSQVPSELKKLLCAAKQWPTNEKVKISFVPQYVILAAGMGQENLSLIPGGEFQGDKFWSNDDLLQDDTRGRRVAIFGGGDGALQDVLRSLTGFEHPLKFIKHLVAKSTVRRALNEVAPQLLSVDRQGRQFSGWTNGDAGFTSVDNYCRDITLRLAKNHHVVSRVLLALRAPKGTAEAGCEPEVALFVLGSNFDKAYLLNRFLVHLIDACIRSQLTHPRKRKRQRQPGKSNVPRLKLRIYWEHEAIGYTPKGEQHTVTVKDLKSNAGLTFDYVADRVVVRYGIRRDTIPGSQMIQLSTQLSNQRTTLCRVELPFAA